MGAEGRARAERTENMLDMLMTLDVSKLSGWLNADAERNISPMLVTLDVSRFSGWLNACAYCQVKEGSIGRRGDMRAGRREGVGRRQRCKQRAGRPRLWGVRVGRCGAHPKHGLHVCDAGRVEAQRLVER